MATKTKTIKGVKSKARLLTSPTGEKEGSREWTATSIRQRKEYPICYDPYLEHIPYLRPAELRHHVIPVSVAAWRMHDDDASVSLCWTCHNRIERQLQRGERVKHMFMMEESVRLLYLCERIRMWLMRVDGQRGGDRGSDL